MLTLATITAAAIAGLLSTSHQSASASGAITGALTVATLFGVTIAMRASMQMANPPLEHVAIFCVVGAIAGALIGLIAFAAKAAIKG